MIYNYFADARHVLLFLKFFVCISILFSGIQNLWIIQSFDEDGLLPWGIVRKRVFFRFFRNLFFDKLYGRNGFFALNIIRIILVIIFMADVRNISFVLLAAVTICSFLIFFRTSLMNNAADQLNNIALLGLCIGHAFSRFSAENYIVYFFGSILIISYFTSGMLKVHEPRWNDGSYLKRIIISRNDQNLFYLKLINPVPLRVFQYLSQATIWWQLVAVISPFFPVPLLLGYVTLGFIFHVSTGILMGLHNFFWTFTGYLPALIFLNAGVLAMLSH